jgi:ferredoxin
MSNRVLIRVVQEGKKWSANATIGQNLMEVANTEGELFGYCKAQLCCTTCRVYIPKRYEKLLNPPTDLEQDVLSELPYSKEYPEKDFIRRMSCQIIAVSQINGLTIYIPPTLI